MSSQNPDFLTALTKQFRESPTPDAPADGTEESEASEEPLVKIDEKSAAFGVLERLMKPPARPRPGEKCEMCGVDVEDNHSHIVNLDTRSLMCACRPCYLLFVGGGAGGGRYRAVPSRYLSLADFAMTPAQWDDLQIPVSVAFFFFNSRANQMVAFYPSPAGATESLLRLETWAEISTANPALFHLQPDVEALLVRVGDARGGPNESFIVPIDACYELVGHLRRLWRGFDGGNEAHSEMEAFFDRVRDQAEPVPTELP